MNRFSKVMLTAALATTVVALPDVASASSHREAPGIAEDQFADNTDVYSFISPNDPDRLVVVMNYVPLLIPHSGPNFYRFSDDALYELYVDNDGDARADMKYLFRFNTTVANGETFLYNVGPIDSLGSANLNVRQTYDVYRIAAGPGNSVDFKQILNDVPTAPWYVGDRSFPDGSYEGVAREAIATANTGESTFAGPRDEPFFVDLHVFDLLGVGGFPSTDGVNVMSIVMEIPIDRVANDGERPASDETGPTSVVGLYARSARPVVTVRLYNNDPLSLGGWVPVSRLGWPLINEVIIPLQDKDRFNRSFPEDDVANFGQYILDPEVPGLLNLVLGTNCPPTPDGGRLDIVGLLAPNDTTPADLLRINITEGQDFTHSGFPNGRTLTDDVTDTLLTVACNSGDAIGDGVDANDLDFFDEMPYLATPHSGNPL